MKDKILSAFLDLKSFSENEKQLQKFDYQKRKRRMALRVYGMYPSYRL